MHELGVAAPTRDRACPMHVEQAARVVGCRTRRRRTAAAARSLRHGTAVRRAARTRSAPRARARGSPRARCRRGRCRPVPTPRAGAPRWRAWRTPAAPSASPGRRSRRTARTRWAVEHAGRCHAGPGSSSTSPERMEHMSPHAAGAGAGAQHHPLSHLPPIRTAPGTRCWRLPGIRRCGGRGVGEAPLTAPRRRRALYDLRRSSVGWVRRSRPSLPPARTRRPDVPRAARPAGVAVGAGDRGGGAVERVPPRTPPAGPARPPGVGRRGGRPRRTTLRATAVRCPGTSRSRPQAPPTRGGTSASPSRRSSPAPSPARRSWPYGPSRWLPSAGSTGPCGPGCPR